MLGGEVIGGARAPGSVIVSIWVTNVAGRDQKSSLNSKRGSINFFHRIIQYSYTYVKLIRIMHICQTVMKHV